MIDKIKQAALQTLRLEAEAIQKLSEFIDADYCAIVELIYQSKGRVVVTGIGKSANIANKIVATLNSTGTPAMFLHAADAIHGDLGMVQKHDVVICISKSGNTPEVKVLVPLVKSMGNALVALVGNVDSYLGEQADHVLNATVEREACPNNLAPTTSTTAQLALGDALAVSLMERRGFSSEDFARYHPGGALGKKLYVRIGDLAVSTNAPQVTSDTKLRDVILEISTNRLGATAVVDDNQLVGVITDGDLRRMLEKDVDLGSLSAKDVMSTTPKTIDAEEMATTGFNLMEQHHITQLLVTKNGALFRHCTLARYPERRNLLESSISERFFQLILLAEMAEEALDKEKEMSFLGHLEELRWRLVRMSAVILIFGTLIFIYTEELMDYILLAHTHGEFITYQFFGWLGSVLGLGQNFYAGDVAIDFQSIQATGQFGTNLFIALVGGIVCAFPYIFAELWGFVKPALRDNEKKATNGVIIYSSLLFFFGILFGYYIVSALTVQFFGNYKMHEDIENIFTITSYLSLVVTSTFFSGLFFELPIIAYLLTRIGIVNPIMLKQYRKHAVVGLLILSAIITPPDIISQIIVTIPLMLLYEVSIKVSARTQKSMEKAAA